MIHSELNVYTNEQLGVYTHYALAASLCLLITNRTAKDVERWRFLRDKGWANMTTEERQEWLGEIATTPAATKGMYTHNDLNRVESAVEEIVARIKSIGYTFPDLVTKTDWTYTDKLWDTDIERYYGNIAKIRELIPVFSDTPIAPKMGERLDYRRANDIEKILTDASISVGNLTQTWCYAGETISGEV